MANHCVGVVSRPDVRNDRKAVTCDRFSLPDDGYAAWHRAKLCAGYQQKMVDTMMVVDAIHYARDEAVPTLLFSDDEDLLPAALAVSAMAPGVPFHWLRRRKVGSRPERRVAEKGEDHYRLGSLRSLNGPECLS